MIAVLRSAWAAPVIAAACLAAVASGVWLGAAWDRLADALTAYRTPPNGAHRR